MSKDIDRRLIKAEQAVAPKPTRRIFVRWPAGGPGGPRLTTVVNGEMVDVAEDEPGEADAIIAVVYE